MKHKSKSCRFFCLALLLLAVGATILLFNSLKPNQKEGLSDPSDFADFTGFVFFTKTKDCDKCAELKGSIEKLYKRFPNNVRVIDCTDDSSVLTVLTKYKVDKNKLPSILSFKDGVNTPYNGFTDYPSLEDFLLKLMVTRKPTTATDVSLSSLNGSKPSEK